MSGDRGEARRELIAVLAGVKDSPHPAPVRPPMVWHVLEPAPDPSPMLALDDVPTAAATAAESAEPLPLEAWAWREGVGQQQQRVTSWRGSYTHRVQPRP